MEESSAANQANTIAEKLDSLVPSDVASLLQIAVGEADRRGWQCYLVGGFVRDAFIGVPDYDIDVSVVGDGAELARYVATATGLAVRVHGRFGTATVALHNTTAQGYSHLDLVTARRERYPAPGALPETEPSSIEDDLARRDFTINAMAVRLTSTGYGELVDPHNGIADLDAKLVRVLYSRSFADDPTRIFRAVKLAKRLGFSIEQETLELILQAVRDNVLATISTEREVHELLLVMSEPHADEMLSMLDTLGVLQAVHPLLSWSYPPGAMRPAERTDTTPIDRQNAYLAIFGAEFRANPNEAEALARWLRLTATQTRVMRDSAKLAGEWLRLDDDALTPAEVHTILSALDPAVLRAYSLLDRLSASHLAWQRLNSYLTEDAPKMPLVGGDFLRELGVEPGPVYKEVLGALRDAVLNGAVTGREEEEQFIRNWLAERGDLES